MKNIWTTFLIVIMFACLTNVQGQLENPGFEDWEDVLVGSGDTIREPAQWSSLKTSDDPTLSALAPVVCTRSIDAHSGNYSVRLINIATFGIVANGVVTNGHLHPNFDPTLANIFTDTLDNQWNTPLTTRPDSIVGWVKYTPQGNDSLQVKLNLHKGYGQQPDADYNNNWIGVAEYISPVNTGGEWMRFSAPFTYFSSENPEYVLVVLNSGSGYTPVEGSIALFDDLELIYNAPQNIPESPEDPSGLIYALDHQHLMIKGMDYTHFRTIRIHDFSGKLVWTGAITAPQIDISSANLKRGLYLVTLAGKGNNFTQKIMLN